MANTIKTEAGAEIYETRIHELADEYIQNLQDSEGYEDDEIKIMMRKSQPFKGMLKYIYNNLFKRTKKDINYNNRNSNIDYGDINLLNGLWDIYTGLCYKYLQNPTILNFSLMIGVDNTTIDSWRRGEYRAGDEGASSARSQSVKKWLKECESALVDSAMTGNPGPMFLLKANYGYTEAPQRIEVVGGQLPDQAAADIAARHRIGQAERPEVPPELFDN